MKYNLDFAEVLEDVEYFNNKIYKQIINNDKEEDIKKTIRQRNLLEEAVMITYSREQNK